MFPMGGFGFGMSLGLDGAFGAQGANQDRMALANGVNGNESPGQIASLAQADKAASLRSASSSIDSNYGYEWDAQGKRIHKANIEQQQRLNIQA
jgi:hypothetical protein